MPTDQEILADHARAIWVAALAAVRPEPLVLRALGQGSPIQQEIATAGRIIVIGAGKAGAPMSEAIETALAGELDRVEGIVSVPAGSVRPLRAIRLEAGRGAGENRPSARGAVIAERVLDLVAGAGPDDVVLCLLSGGGSALLPAPVVGLSLADKLAVTDLLHACGATIAEMNAVRKHLSRVKGGRLAAGFKGRAWYSFIISDVVGDALDVIASGPTAADSTTFRDAWQVLEKYQLVARCPASVIDHLRRGMSGQVAETPKSIPSTVHNLIIGQNRLAVAAAAERAAQLGYAILDLGSYLQGDTSALAGTMASIARSVMSDGVPVPPPACLLCGGETTVTLQPGHGVGGRNQEFVLATLAEMGPTPARPFFACSVGTDGEDGPTDSAGAAAGPDVLRAAADKGLDARDFLARHDAYHYFDKAGGLVRTGLTETNVMDVRFILVR